MSYNFVCEGFLFYWVLSLKSPFPRKTSLDASLQDKTGVEYYWNGGWSNVCSIISSKVIPSLPINSWPYKQHSDARLRKNDQSWVNAWCYDNITHESNGLLPGQANVVHYCLNYFLVCHLRLSDYATWLLSWSGRVQCPVMPTSIPWTIVLLFSSPV